MASRTFPARGRVCTYSDFHLGVDYKAANGDPLVAPERGKVVSLSDLPKSNPGKMVTFLGVSGHTYRFMHLKSCSPIRFLQSECPESACFFLWSETYLSQDLTPGVHGGTHRPTQLKNGPRRPVGGDDRG
jgi:hypothetical protein